jgi:hypothetical protein
VAAARASVCGACQPCTCFACRAAQGELQSALVAAQASAPLRAIFAHLDILGASVNNKQQAAAGLSPKTFPADVPIFTGHYHKPHVVPRSKITYIGSPFQRTNVTAAFHVLPVARTCRIECNVLNVKASVVVFYARCARKYLCLPQHFAFQHSVEEHVDTSVFRRVLLSVQRATVSGTSASARCCSTARFELSKTSS